MVDKIDVENADQVREKKDELAKDLLELLENLIEKAPRLKTPSEAVLGGLDDADRLKVELLKTAYSHATDVERRLADAERQKRQDAAEAARQTRQDRQFVATLVAAAVAAAATLAYAVIDAIRFFRDP
jgi:galactose-1-phosphate uridylyltransferase